MKRNIYSTDGRGAVEFNPYPLQAPAPQRATAPLFYDCVWIDGELVPAEDVDVSNQPAIFEEISCYPTVRGPAIFRLETHLQRFMRAASVLGAGELRYSLLELRRAVHVTAHVNSLNAGAVRPIVYVDHQPGGAGYLSVAIVAAGQAAAVANPAPVSGLRLQTMQIEQEGGGEALTREALQNRGARATHARIAARQEQFDEALLLSRDGTVVDCTGGNLFVVRDGVVFTAPPAGDDDVARDTAITLLQDLGIDCASRAISRDMLLQADESFISGVHGAILPVAQVDEHSARQPAPGAVTSRLQSLLARTTRGEAPRSRGWLEYVMMEPLF